VHFNIRDPERGVDPGETIAFFLGEHRQAFLIADDTISVEISFKDTVASYTLDMSKQ
jgi:hypothetical protein